MAIEIIKAIQSISSPFWDSFFTYATMLGEETFPLVVFAIVFLGFNKSFGYKLGFSLLISSAVVQFTKETLQVPRPFFQDGIRSLRIETATGYSFPSGHTQTAASFFYTISLQLKNRWLKYLMYFLIAAVAISRMYLGVHTIWDVLGGLAIGLFVAHGVFRCFGTEKFNIRLLAVLVIIVGLFALLFNPDIEKVVGVTSALIIGYFIESIYIKYDVNVSVAKKAARIIIGLAGLILIKAGLKPVLGDIFLADYVRYFLIGMWGIVFAPYLFKRFIK